MLSYWKARDSQEDHEEVYQGSSTYMMQQVGGLQYCCMRQRDRRVKLMLDWGVHGRRMKLMGLDGQRTMSNLYGNGLTKSYRL